MGTATNFTQDELARVPNSRDPWALLRTVPGVSLDRVNIAGNETGQQSSFVAKGARQGDAVWTMDGVPITDMATAGASPTYFDYDAFDEIQISTGGNDIKQATGGVGLNFVVKRGTNQFRGTARGYYTEDGLEAVNVPGRADRARRHRRHGRSQPADRRLRRRLRRSDRSGQAVLLGFLRQPGHPPVSPVGARDRPDDPQDLQRQDQLAGDAEGHGQLPVLQRRQDQERPRARATRSFEPASARYNQGNFYTDNPLHGLWKWEDNRVMSSAWFLSGKYAYYNTGFTLESIGPLTEQMGISPLRGQTFGSTNASYFTRPQHTVNVDSNYFKSLGDQTHEFKFGGGWRRTDIYSRTIYPGNGVVAYENSATDFRARVYREGAGTNRAQYLNFYFGDTISWSRVTLDLGVRYDRQWGEALASQTASNAAFGALVPGIQFTGYEPPFHWNDITPRVGLTYALDEGRKSILRASFSKNAGQLTAVGTYVGYANPSSAAGWVEYPWNDLNGDHLAQTNEVLVNQPLLASGNGFNTANPTAVTSANRIDPDFKAPSSLGFIVGFDRELMPNLALQVNYTYGRVTEHPMFPFIGVATSDWQSLAPLTGTLPDGSAYNIPLFQPNPTIVGGQRRRAVPDQLRRLLHEVQRHRAVDQQAHVQPLADAPGDGVQQPDRGL